MLLRFVRSLKLLCCASLIALLYVISKFLYLGQSPFSIARLMSFRNCVFNSDRFLFCYTASFPRQTVDRQLASHASTTVLLNPSTSVSSSLLISPPSCRWAMLLLPQEPQSVLLRFLTILFTSELPSIVLWSLDIGDLSGNSSPDRSLEYSLALCLASLAWCWLRMLVFFLHNIFLASC